ncbi:hypothetical protein [Kutzneria kofuensis]|uniref:Uncharacterized protein n=1 Tax=Kutzneria kofuensis TaxID=103725 RepID=A0A7W9KPF2_9PSEU|nr:hypothetical protein [Kutzneria kofuensis]MBB5896309.1 hypothetical protein [Kutzneria kofuensis]
MPRPPQGGGEGLVVEWCGPHALIRRCDETASEARILGSLPHLPGTVVIMASAVAQPHADLCDAVRACLLAVRSWPRESVPRAAWLAVPGLGNPVGQAVNWLCGLAAEFGMDILAPHGMCAAAFGAGIYVGPTSGGQGWRRFGPAGAGDLVTTRFPMPSWEYLLPYAPVQVADLVADPVPAGLSVRPAGTAPSGPSDAASHVPMSGAVPKLIVGGADAPPHPAAVAEIIMRLPLQVRTQLLLVPTTVAAAGHEWIGELVRHIGHEIAVSAGTQLMTRAGRVRTVVLGDNGEELLAPFATLLRYSPDVERPEVLDVVPPPGGWVQCGGRHYQHVEDRYRLRPGGPEVIAEVVPGGLVVRQGDGHGPSLPFDPTGWTLALGTPGEAVGVSLLPALQSLLDGLTDLQRRTVRLRLLGLAGPAVRDGLERIVRVAGVRLEESLPAASPAPVSPPPPPEMSSSPPAPPSLPVPPTMPVITVSSPDRPQPKPLAPPPAEPTWPRAEEAPEPASAAPPEPAPKPEPAVPTPARLPWSVRGRIQLEDRPSTPAEQARLSASGGTQYTEALAMVNVALSAWPMLRPEAKADYIAVCMYLGYGEGGAVALNETLGTGGPAPFDGYLPCLTSGLRRLPTHRRVVLRQEKLEDGDECPYAAGTVLDEPAFLSASAALDITTPEAGLDVLIWPLSARRTTELVMGRAVDETVFPAGRRFKALAVLTSDAEPGEDVDEVRAPKTAVLVRELVPGEEPKSPEALARDEAALSRLERAWQARQEAELRVVEDPDLVARLTIPMTVAADTGVTPGAEFGGTVGVAS